MKKFDDINALINYVDGVTSKSTNFEIEFKLTDSDGKVTRKYKTFNGFLKSAIMNVIGSNDEFSKFEVFECLRERHPIVSKDYLIVTVSV